MLYLDLDTLPVGDLSGIASYRGELAMIAQLSDRKPGHQSAVMSFRAGGRTAALYERFKAKPDEWMAGHPKGDGPWIDTYAKGPTTLQDAFPGQICSHKFHASKGAPDGVRLVCGHGKPRFSHIKAGWAHTLWKERAA